MDDDFIVEMWPIDRPLDYATNPKHHPEEAIEKLMAIIARVGLQVALVVDEQGTIAKGQKTRAAARRLGYTKIPVKVATGVSPEDIEEWRIADNAASLDSLWDEGNLGLVLEKIQQAGRPLTNTGLDEDEIERILGTADAPTVERLPLQALPEMTWVLIGLPTIRYHQIAELVEQASTIPDAIVESVVNETGKDDDA